MPVDKKEERMFQLADELARSGEFSGWWDIEVELRSRGYPRARSLLDTPARRERLDRECAKAKGKA